MNFKQLKPSTRESLRTFHVKIHSLRSAASSDASVRSGDPSRLSRAGKLGKLAARTPRDPRR